MWDILINAQMASQRYRNFLFSHLALSQIAKCGQWGNEYAMKKIEFKKSLLGGALLGTRGPESLVTLSRKRNTLKFLGALIQVDFQSTQ